MAEEQFVGGLAELLESQSQTTLSEPVDVAALATDTTVEVEPAKAEKPVEIKSDAQEEKDDMDLFAKVYAKIKGDEAKLAKARRLIKANAILARPNIDAEVDAFILEMAGVKSFEHTVSPNSMYKFTFRAIDSKGVEQVFQQWQRDIVIGRSKLGRDDSLMDYYKAAMSLKSFTVIDPRTGRPIKETIIDQSIAMNHASTEIDPRLDLPCRSSYVYLRDVLIGNSSSFQAFITSFGEFETLMMDITFLLQEQPDFFQKES